MPRSLSPLLVALLLVTSCTSAARRQARPDEPPVRGAVRADELIRPGEKHFARLWRVTQGGENAEAYWNPSSDRLVLQRRRPEHGVECDRIYVTDLMTGDLVPISSGKGVTTCSFFMPRGERVIFASTRSEHESCPPPPDRSRGYLWALYPEYDLWVRDLRYGVLKRLTETWGYDAEATVSPRGDRIVFTSTRTGDPELWTCDLEGGDLVQVTNQPGYDGGAFFSHDGEKLVFRATAFTPGEEDAELEEFYALLADWLVAPSHMELVVVDADGSNRHQVTALGGANFAPVFFPDDKRLLFASNHHDLDARGRPNFDLFAVDLDGGNLERITFEEDFDSFPMFSPDGKYLAFSSNRGGTEEGETNVFIAEWK